LAHEGVYETVRTEWAKPARIPHLPEGGLHLGRVELTAGTTPRLIAEAERLINSGERARAAQIRSVAARQEFVVGRGLLRRLVGDATGMDPASIAFEPGPNGKPQLRELAGIKSGIDFNVSHSGGVVLIGISRAGAVGVDVEFIDPAFAASDELLEMARDSFYSEEFRRIEQAGTERERLLQFYRAWTRKEAVAKADGRGIASSVDYISSPAEADGESRVSLAGVEASRRMDYFVQTPDAGLNHLAAVATLRSGQPISLLDAAALPG
jgi:4'-phosphopantetheinyl transferase